MTGAKVEAAQKQAYAEALDRMKRGMADATARSGAEAGAPATAAVRCEGRRRDPEEFPGAAVPANGKAKAGAGPIRCRRPAHGGHAREETPAPPAPRSRRPPDRPRKSAPC